MKYVQWIRLDIPYQPDGNNIRAMVGYTEFRRKIIPKFRKSRYQIGANDC